MKVAFVSALLPYPLVSGGQVRMYQLLKYLSKTNEIHLYSFIRDPKEQALVSHLGFCKSVTTVFRGRAWQPKYIIRSFFGSHSLLFTTYSLNDMKAKLSKGIIAHHVDLVHIEPGYVGESIPQIGVPIVASEHNVEHDVYIRYIHQQISPLARGLFLNDVRKMKTDELNVWKYAAEITAVSPDDASVIKELSGKRTVTVVPNGVDTAFYAYKPRKSISADSPTFLYIGNFKWMQNMDAVSFLLTEIWPKILEKTPNAKLRIVGANAQNVLRMIPSRQVSWISFVEDMRDEYYNATILIAPIRVGGGTQYKIIESMACGLPVLTTPLGAHGFADSKDSFLWIAETAEAFVDNVQIIFRSPDRVKMLARAREEVEKSYSWDIIARELSLVWKRAYETNVS